MCICKSFLSPVNIYFITAYCVVSWISRMALNPQIFLFNVTSFGSKLSNVSAPERVTATAYRRMAPKIHIFFPLAHLSKKWYASVSGCSAPDPLQRWCKNPGLISHWRLNVLRWRLIFVDSEYWTSSCHRSAAWKFEVGSRFLENVFTAALQSCSWPNRNPSARNLTTTIHLVASHVTDRNIIYFM